ncbi:MAG: hypothetical protein Q9O74_10870 [Planctomycetota bacterium]|nr:hypothetical protein [Planctomycetota bacterium]
MNTNDVGAGSLRQAVIDANAASGADIVEFDASLRGSTIGLTSGFIQITDALTIRGVDSDGNALGINISGSSTSRHFVVSDGNGASDFSASISDLALHSGVVVGTFGGAIFNAENLTLDRMSFTSNSATGGGSGGALQNGVTLTGRGAGNWTQTDMSATVEGNVPAIVGGNLTAWLTPTNIINYAGYDNGSALVRIHWRPGDPVWNTDTLTDFVTDNQTRPTGTLSAYVSAAGTVNVVAADSNANIVRLWSADGENNTFSLDNLSDLAVRI